MITSSRTDRLLTVPITVLGLGNETKEKSPWAQSAARHHCNTCRGAGSRCALGHVRHSEGSRTWGILLAFRLTWTSKVIHQLGRSFQPRAAQEQGKAFRWGTEEQSRALVPKQLASCEAGGVATSGSKTRSRWIQQRPWHRRRERQGRKRQQEHRPGSWNLTSVGGSVLACMKSVWASKR